MGCGQSKIHLYPRKSKSKANGKKSGHADSDADADEEEGHVDEGGEKEINRDKDNIDDENTLSDCKESPEPPNGEISVSLLRAKNLSLLQSQEISSSQQNFFRMLDQKIEEGPDYDSASETEIALEEARLNALVQHWESASLTASLCSSASRSLQTTPVRQVPIRQPPPPRNTVINNSIPQQPLNAELLPHYVNNNAISEPLSSSVMLTIGQTIYSTTAIQQQQQKQQQQPLVGTIIGSSQSQLLAKVNLSPKRGDPKAIISQSVIHQSYGISQSPTPQTPGLVGRTRPLGGIPPHMQLSYYGQPPPPPPQTQSYFGEILHPMQVPQTAPEYRFPPAISVQRLAPQVQRQIRETQELIKDSCPQLYAAGYGSPGPPLRTQPRTPRRPTLDAQYSQEFS